MTLYPNPHNKRFVPAPAWDPIREAIRQLERQFGPMKLVKPADLPEEEERTLHPEGTYNAVVTNCIAKKSRQGNDMLEFTLKTDQGKLRYWLTYIPTKRFMIERFHQVLTAVGVKPDVVDAVDDWDELALATVKAKVLIAVTHEDRDGKTFDSVTAIDELGTEPF